MKQAVSLGDHPIFRIGAGAVTMLESEQAARAEICSLLGVAPHCLRAPHGATYASVEQFNTRFGDRPR